MYIEEYVIQLDGTELRLRNAREEDAEMLIDYLKQTCGETRNGFNVESLKNQ